jgi:hypothetical protein
MQAYFVLHGVLPPSYPRRGERGRRFRLGTRPGGWRRNGSLGQMSRKPDVPQTRYPAKEKPHGGRSVGLMRSGGIVLADSSGRKSQRVAASAELRPKRRRALLLLESIASGGRLRISLRSRGPLVRRRRQSRVGLLERPTALYGIPGSSKRAFNAGEFLSSAVCARPL